MIQTKPVPCSPGERKRGEPLISSTDYFIFTSRGRRCDPSWSSQLTVFLRAGKHRDLTCLWQARSVGWDSTHYSLSVLQQQQQQPQLVLLQQVRKHLEKISAGLGPPSVLERKKKITCVSDHCWIQISRCSSGVMSEFAFSASHCGDTSEKKSLLAVTSQYCSKKGRRYSQFLLWGGFLLDINHKIIESFVSAPYIRWAL